MRVAAGVAAALGVPMAADLAGLPPWVYVFSGLIGSGVLVRYYVAGAERRVAEATAQKARAEAESTVEDLQAKLIGRVREQYVALELELERTKTALADARTQVAQTHSKNVTLQHAIERLHDELATTRAEAGLLERRDPPPTP